MPRAKPISPKVDPSHSLARGLVAAWPFVEMGGTTIRDSSGVCTGSFQITDAMGWVTAGGYGAVEFDVGGAADGACNDYIDLGDKDAFDGHAQMSFALLVRNKKASIVASGTELMCEKTGGGLDSYSAGWSQSENVDVSFGTAGGNVTATYTDGIPAGSGTSWHLVVGTYDGANVRCYVDGIFGGGPSAQTGAVNATAHSLRLGSSSASLSWDGYMAFAGLWSRALSHSEAIDLWVDPFAMFRPRRRVTYSVPVAGGIVVLRRRMEAA